MPLNGARFATDEDRRWWADLWADRCIASSFAEQAVAYGIATTDDLEEFSQGWRAWAEHRDGMFAVLHGEIIAVIRGAAHPAPRGRP